MITDFSKAFDLVPQGKLFTKIVATGVDLRAVVWVKEKILIGLHHSSPNLAPNFNQSTNISAIS